MTDDQGAPADVVVVTVTYNGADLVARCLNGLLKQDLRGLRMQVVVVDNASTDGTAALVAQHYPHVRLIRSPVNLGFAGGNNVVLDTVESPYVILINNDAVPEPGFVAALVESLAASPATVGALTATVLLADRFRPATSSDHGDVVHGADGNYVPDPMGQVTLVNSTGNEVRTDGFGVDRGWLCDARSHHPERDVFGFCGAAAILRTDALRDVGTFDPDFFLYYEDTDLSWRLRLAGYTIEHSADAVVHHVHAASTSEGSELFRFHDGRNRLLMLLKSATPQRAVRAIARYVLTTCSIAVRRSQPAAHVRTRCRVLMSFLRLTPKMLRKRRAIGRTARVPRAEVERLLVPPQPRSPGAYRR
ncbi:glycosyltransferase family 2 protein [Cellulomonas chengniuliangii]|uniref:Glycosyltransferase family 2 protein n=1 Tax=Cellulomonas chengniuliangii TaxID=2968084 RepID=A0ABY5KZ35_9CELL|nr:glycosyltransferase family 2 protein [Cellulomonas chengniuliangii]MCC2310078.1 glycosyltransferase family 2 protein [Cellulomonas chengniuliangii]UUI74527.1 glycosyltransferase family 2 protein [Cellulomonas chengniuliangii]